ncbi:hypothetical protein [uncultured Methanobrevibacter sp.]|uniref:hypothetical protein n=1 Tax=uncultured Methanobrevibacter sp. TaxID=253161 RepID=UPI0025D813F5|nr:hypothetical protein [uncultured Methanobrevibacter sp.]
MKEVTLILLLIIAIIGIISIVIVKLYYRDKEKDDEREKLEEFINSTKADYDNERRKRTRRTSKKRPDYTQAQNYANTIDSQYNTAKKEAKKARSALADDLVETENVGGTTALLRQRAQAMENAPKRQVRKVRRAPAEAVTTKKVQRTPERVKTQMVKEEEVKPFQEPIKPVHTATINSARAKEEQPIAKQVPMTEKQKEFISKDANKLVVEDTDGGVKVVKSVQPSDSIEELKESAKIEDSTPKVEEQSEVVEKAEKETAELIKKIEEAKEEVEETISADKEVKVEEAEETAEAEAEETPAKETEKTAEVKAEETPAKEAEKTAEVKAEETPAKEAEKTAEVKTEKPKAEPAETKAEETPAKETEKTAEVKTEKPKAEPAETKTEETPAKEAEKTVEVKAEEPKAEPAKEEKSETPDIESTIEKIKKASAEKEEAAEEESAIIPEVKAETESKVDEAKSAIVEGASKVSDKVSQVAEKVYNDDLHLILNKDKKVEVDNTPENDFVTINADTETQSTSNELINSAINSIRNFRKSNVPEKPVVVEEVDDIVPEDYAQELGDGIEYIGDTITITPIHEEEERDMAYNRPNKDVDKIYKEINKESYNKTDDEELSKSFEDVTDETSEKDANVYTKEDYEKIEKKEKDKQRRAENTKKILGSKGISEEELHKRAEAKERSKRTRKAAVAEKEPVEEGQKTLMMHKARNDVEEVYINGTLFELKVGQVVMFDIKSETYSSQILKLKPGYIGVKYRSKKIWVKSNTVKKILK